MNSLFNRVKIKILKSFIKIPGLSRYNTKWFSLLGVKLSEKCFIASNVKFIGDYSNLTLARNVSISYGGVLTLKNKIIIGENTGIAYQVLILTSSNPRGPLNKLVRVYKKISKPVVIGSNCWIGARVTILPGVTIGDFCVVAAGSVVNKDVLDYTVVAGVPAKAIKQLNPKKFTSK